MVTRRQLLALSATSLVGLSGCGYKQPNETETPKPKAPEPKTPEEDPPVLDIRDFGAEVDGKTDDTEAIQQALTAAQPGATVSFPAGTTLISADENKGRGAIRLNGDELADNLTIAGVGSDSIIRMAGGQNGHHRAFYFHVQSGYSGLVVRDLRVDGNKEEQRKPGHGGHGFFSDRADSAEVPVDVRIENVWVENCNQSGITPRHGGFVLNHCTVRDCIKHGISPDSWTDVRKHDPRITIKNCYAAGNGRESGAPTYGIDVSGGKVLVEDCVCENNGQGTKTTEQVLEATYRRVRLRNNAYNGYVRPNTKTETGQRSRVIFDDVVSEGNQNFGFRLGRDTNYTVPFRSKIIARNNAHRGGNVYITENASLSADEVVCTNSINGFGLSSNASRRSYINDYYYANNHLKAIRDRKNLKIINEWDITEELNTQDLPQAERFDISDQEIPHSADVGASDRLTKQSLNTEQ